MTFTLSSADLIEVLNYLMASFGTGFVAGHLHKGFKVLMEKL